MGAETVQAQAVAAIVLTYQPDPDRLRATLSSLTASDPCPGRILIVDNGSESGVLDSVVVEFPGIEVVVMPDNVGYGAAMNRAVARLAASEVRHYLFLTHEVVLRDGAVGELMAQLDRDSSAGLVGPVLGVLSTPTNVWSAGGTLSGLRQALRHRAIGTPMMALAGVAPYRVEWLDGACLLADVAAFAEVGGFREDLFLYCEDVDLARRMHVAGWSSWCVPAAVALQESSSTPPYLDGRNRAMVLGRRGAFGVAIDVALRAVADPLRGDGLRRATLTARGLRDGLAGRFDRALALERPRQRARTD